MPARKSVTKARKAKTPTRKAVKKAAKPAARKAVARTKAKSSKAPAKKAAKRAKTSKTAARKTVRPAAKAKKAVKKTAVARPKQARVAAKTAPRRPAKPAAAKKAAKPKAKAASRPAARGKHPKLVAVAPRMRRPEAVPVDEEEGYEPEFHRNLLLGPRNVQPYVARKGEAYMGKEQLEHFRNILSSWKRDLMEEVDRTMNHMKDEAANPPDPNDRATLESEFALELRTRDRERKLIRKIDEALKRIEDASYGYCLETGEPIGIKRLEARPVATLCIEAQERRERREKQYGDRDDWYR